MGTRLGSIVLIGLSAAVTGCGPSSTSGLGTDLSLLTTGEVVFAAQQRRPNGVMDALFTGKVVLDAQGCFRLDIPPGEEVSTTVVWPFGASLEGRGPTMRVLDEDGRLIVRVGGDTSFGGGFVPGVDHMASTGALSPNMVSALRIRCPGQFWIVGDVVR